MQLLKEIAESRPVSLGCSSPDDAGDEIPGTAEPMKNFFAHRDPWGHGLALWVMVVLVFLAPLAVSALFGLRLENDVASWLPAHDPQAQVYHWCREHFPEEEQVILTWRGSTIGDPRLPLLVGRLQGKIDPDGVRRGGSPYIESVLHAETLLQKMVDQGIDQDDALQRLEGSLIGWGWLKVQLTESGREERDRTIKTLQQALEQELHVTIDVLDAGKVWQPAPGNETLFEQSLQQHADFGVVGSEDAAGQLDPPERPFIEVPVHDLQFRWAGMAANAGDMQRAREALLSVRGFATAAEPQGRLLVEDCFTSVGGPIGVMVTLSSAGVADKSAALAAIREAAEKSFIPGDTVWLGGSAAATAELNAGVIRSAWDAERPWSQWYQKSVMALSGIVGILFALVSLKSLRLGGLVIAVSYYAAVLGLALIPLTGGTMNMVLIVLPTLLMVLALSGAIHVANYWKHAVWEDPTSAVNRATEMARVPCLMAAFTTAIGLISLATSELQPVKLFGIYAAIGTLISVVMVLFGLPALLQMMPLRRVRPDEVNPRIWIGFGEQICRHSRSIMITSVVCSLICLVGLRWFQTETKVIKYFQPESTLVQDYQQIEDSLTGITPIEVVVSFSRQAQSEYRFLERMEIVRAVEQKIREHKDIRGTLSLAAFQQKRLPPGDEASTRERIFFNRRSNETEKRIKDGEIAGAEAFVQTVDYDVRPGLEQPWAENGAELWRINAQAAILAETDYETLTRDLDVQVRDVARYYPGMSHVVTGTVPLFLRTQQAVLESLIMSFGLAFVLIAGVLMLVLRDPVAGAISMIPNLLPVVSVFGLVAWYGTRIDVGTMVTASVALGIAVDGTLHLLTWFRDGLRKGYSRERSVMLALSHCGPAMWQTSAAVGIGLLMLLPAELLLISRFGWLMSALIGAALLGDLLLLPAFLVGPLGALIESRIEKRRHVRKQGDAVIPSPHISLPEVREHSRYVG
ncbi:MAG: MMPL family transporter [Planctomycetaceae bacterium]|nr:MMPL family transporter [Planctomycetaceae bacterium]